MNLREELFKLFNFDEGGVARWVLIRHFTGEVSQYYRKESHEAVGGPPYKYVDTLVQTYSVPAFSAGSARNPGQLLDRPANIEEGLYKFFFEHDVVIAELDEIFELNYYQAAKPIVVYNPAEENVSLGKVSLKERYKVRKVEVYRFDEGRPEFLAVLADTTFYR